MLLYYRPQRRTPFIATAETFTPPAPHLLAPAKNGAGRLVSLDVFRGITIAAMILVNDPGSWGHIYPPLEHASWNGWTPTDLIFPFFLFIVGVSMTLSFHSRVRRGVTRRSLIWRVLRRSALIFVIGLFLNGFPDFNFHSIRIMGVLQRIAICYLAAGWLYLLVYRPGASTFGNDVSNEDVRFRRSGPHAAIATLAVIFLVGYWALLIFVPVPGSGAGHLNPNDNLGAYIDRTLLNGHLWSESKTWDPEGLLSTLPAVATTLIGILAGEWLRSKRSSGRKALGLLLAGAVLMLIGRALHPYFPINKNLWTSTFVLFTGGFALVLLGVCYWVVDLRRWRTWTTPFLAFGTNAILAYALAAILSEISTDFEFTFSVGRDQTLHGWIYQRFFTPYATPNNASLAFAVFFVICVYVCIWPLYRRKIFIRI